MYNFPSLLKIIQEKRVIKPWKIHLRDRINGIEEDFLKLGEDLDKALINSDEIRLFDDEALRYYKINLIVIHNCVAGKYKQYQSYFLSNAYNPNYEKLQTRLSQLFRRVNGEIQDRKRSFF